MRLIALLLTWLGGAAFVAANELTIELRAAQHELIIRRGERTLLVYAFATNQFKPYVRELYTLRGQNVLRDAPADHRHHHGLMYGIRVNGVNFWEETDAPGLQQPVGAPRHRLVERADGRRSAQFTQRIHWLPRAHRPGARTDIGPPKPLLIEQRTLTLSVDEAAGEVALEWDAEFQVGDAPVMLHGQNYNGLGWRPPAAFDGAVEFQNPDREPYPPPGQHASIPTRWTSATGILDGRNFTLALMAQSTNPGRSRFFSMVKPFAYLSATQGLDREPLEYNPAERFRLRFLALVWSEARPAEAVERRWNAWPGR